MVARSLNRRCFGMQGDCGCPLPLLNYDPTGTVYPRRISLTRTSVQSGRGDQASTPSFMLPAILHRNGRRQGEGRSDPTERHAPSCK